jgi:uncharacterized protein
MDNKLLILHYLAKNHPASPTMHSLAKALKIPYATFYRTLKASTDLVQLEAVGKAKTVRLNLAQDVLAAHLAIASWEERTTFLNHHPIINKIAQELPTDDVVLLFGSYAKGTAQERSDIDLFIINESGQKTISFGKHELLYKKTISPIFVTRKEYEQMLQESGENVGKQALKNHIVLQNPQAYWELTLHALRARSLQTSV